MPLLVPCWDLKNFCAAARSLPHQRLAAGCAHLPHLPVPPSSIDIVSLHPACCGPAVPSYRQPDVCVCPRSANFVLEPSSRAPSPAAALFTTTALLAATTSPPARHCRDGRCSLRFMPRGGAHGLRRVFLQRPCAGGCYAVIPCLCTDGGFT